MFGLPVEERLRTQESMFPALTTTLHSLSGWGRLLQLPFRMSNEDTEALGNIPPALQSWFCSVPWWAVVPPP